MYPSSLGSHPLLVAALLALAIGAPALADHPINDTFQSDVQCVDGLASEFPCDRIDLLSHLPLKQMGGGQGNDLWGWTDAVTGREYAIMGRTSGTAVIDVTDPYNPRFVGNIPGNGAPSVWRDIKVYRDHAFIVSEAIGHGMQVVDLTQLRVARSGGPLAVETVYTRIGSAHNVAINEETGFAYIAGAAIAGVANGVACSSGLHMVDISNPSAPRFAGCFSDDGYTHDAQCVSYRGPDADHEGAEICVAANEDTVTLVDVSDKSAPVMLSRSSYSGSAYTHQAWLTENHQFLLVNDELDERDFDHPTRTYVWNVRDLDAPILSGFYESSEHSIDHNLYIKGNYVYQANYTAGVRILQLTGLGTASLTERAFFDFHLEEEHSSSVVRALHPEGGERKGQGEFDGAWSVYPWFPSGVVIASSIHGGLFVLQPRIGTGGGGTAEPGLGGSVDGLATDKVTCRNQTSGQAFTIELDGAGSWDCGAAGLTADADDRITQTVSGTALASTVSGSVEGLSVDRITCRNQSAGRMANAAVTPASDWSCADVSLAYAAGELASVTLGGPAEGESTTGAQSASSVGAAGPASTPPAAPADETALPGAGRSIPSFDRFEPFWKKTL